VVKAAIQRRILMASRTSRIIAVLALLCPATLVAASRSRPPTTGRICEAGLSLRNLLDQTAKYGKRKPRTCVQECYRPYVQTAVVLNASPIDHEQFLFDYLQACLDAARNPVREEHLKEAIDVAHQYIAWFAATRPRTPGLAARDTRLFDVVYQLGDTYKELLDWPDLLDDYEEYATNNPDSLRDPRAVQRWMTGLRTYKTTAERTVSQTREAFQNVEGYRDDWQLFLTTLHHFRAKKHSHLYSDEIAFAEAVLK
jgi:hypothetical protein